MNKNEKLFKFNKEHMTTKDDVLAKIDSVINEMKDLSISGDNNHSKNFYKNLTDVLINFYKCVDERIFFKLEDYWCYYFAVNSKKIFLSMAYYPDFENQNDDKFIEYKERYDLIYYDIKELTIKEYAKLNDTSEINVRQWIRRGKIKQARKYGNVWKISELAEYKKNGYRYAGYKWDRNVVEFDDNYKYLKNYDKVLIAQDDNNCDIYNIELQIKEENNVYFYKTVREEKISDKEKEKFELMLISNINVEYTGGIRMLFS